MSHPFRRPLAALTTLVLTGAALATVVLHADVEQLAGGADLIVDGSVRSSTTTLDAATGAIWTVYEIAVRETLAGTPSESVQVSVPGGTVGDLSQEISGAPSLASGGRYVLFLWPDGARHRILGQAQGAFRISRGDDGSETCRNDVARLALVAADGRTVTAEAVTIDRRDLGRRVGAVVAAKRAAEVRRQKARVERLARLRRQAERTAEMTRGRPGGAR